MRAHLSEPPTVKPVVRIGFCVVTTLMLGIFATPAFGLMVLCAIPIIVAFIPWIAVHAWNETKSHGTPHDYPDPEVIARAPIVLSGPIDRLTAHAHLTLHTQA